MRSLETSMHTSGCELHGAVSNPKCNFMINNGKREIAIAFNPLDRQVKVAGVEVHAPYPRRTIPDLHPQASRSQSKRERTQYEARQIRDRPGTLTQLRRARLSTFSPEILPRRNGG